MHACGWAKRGGGEAFWAVHSSHLSTHSSIPHIHQSYTKSYYTRSYSTPLCTLYIRLSLPNPSPPFLSLSLSPPPSFLLSLKTNPPLSSEPGTEAVNRPRMGERGLGERRKAIFWGILGFGFGFGFVFFQGR